jgi:hypothetical protein
VDTDCCSLHAGVRTRQFRRSNGTVYAGSVNKKLLRDTWPDVGMDNRFTQLWNSFYCTTGVRWKTDHELEGEREQRTKIQDRQSRQASQIRQVRIQQKLIINIILYTNITIYNIIIIHQKNLSEFLLKKSLYKNYLFWLCSGHRVEMILQWQSSKDTYRSRTSTSRLSRCLRVKTRILQVSKIEDVSIVLTIAAF